MDSRQATAVVGVGIDVIEVSRIAKAMEDPRFAATILTAGEMRGPRTPDRLARTWAAKEAVAKAIGIGLRWHDVEILEDPREGTTVRILGGSRKGGVEVVVTVSLNAGLACALAIAQEPGPLAVRG